MGEGLQWIHVVELKLVSAYYLVCNFLWYYTIIMAAALGTEASNEIIYCSNTFKSSIFFHVASMGNIKNLMISHTQLEQGLVSIYLVCQQQ